MRVVLLVIQKNGLFGDTEERNRFRALLQEEFSLRNGEAKYVDSMDVRDVVTIESHRIQQHADEIKHPRRLRRGIVTAEVAT